MNHSGSKAHTMDGLCFHIYSSTDAPVLFLLLYYDNSLGPFHIEHLRPQMQN